MKTRIELIPYSVSSHFTFGAHCQWSRRSKTKQANKPFIRALISNSMLRWSLKVSFSIIDLLTKTKEIILTRKNSFLLFREVLIQWKKHHSHYLLTNMFLSEMNASRLGKPSTAIKLTYLFFYEWIATQNESLHKRSKR
mmetsp:Transcript_7355/g.11198  ORF Transcript_7355/g.11198 Transcript_7355/m.11198 type:complete len:139 (-) Transcript_7355:35-451(-)